MIWKALWMLAVKIAEALSVLFPHHTPMAIQDWSNVVAVFIYPVELLVALNRFVDVGMYAIVVAFLIAYQSGEYLYAGLRTLYGIIPFFK